MEKVPEPNPGWKSHEPDPGTSYAPYRIYNIGNNNPVELMEFIETLEHALQAKAKKKFMPLQKGDLPATCADIDDLVRDIGFKPETSLKVGIKRFVDWHKSYYARNAY